MKLIEMFQIALLGLLILPVIYWIRLWHSKVGKIEECDFISTRKITIILPMRNERKNVTRKLTSVVSEIIDDRFVDLIVADSNSEDETSFLATEFLQKSQLEDGRWNVINFDIPGKNIAMNGALEIIGSEIIVMSDADADVSPGWLKIVRSRLEDEEIGVVSGMEIVGDSRGKNFHSYYRSNSNWMRIRESEIDSTPVLEGSLLAWKISAVGSFRFNERMNADDAQIGLMAIRNGFRSVIDPRIEFKDYESRERVFSESIRRSQGLSMALAKNADLALLNRNKGSRRAIFNAIILYIFFPWIFALFIINSTIAISINPRISHSWEFYSFFSIVLICFSHSGRSLIMGCAISMIAHIQALIGKRYNNWEPLR